VTAARGRYANKTQDCERTGSWYQECKEYLRRSGSHCVWPLRLGCWFSWLLSFPVIGAGTWSSYKHCSSSASSSPVHSTCGTFAAGEQQRGHPRSDLQCRAWAQTTLLVGWVVSPQSHGSCGISDAWPAVATPGHVGRDQSARTVARWVLAIDLPGHPHSPQVVPTSCLESAPIGQGRRRGRVSQR
jgi:hypothetical protein